MDLKDKCTKWGKNRELLGFGAKIKVGSDGRMMICLENCPKEYLNAAYSLADSIVIDGLGAIKKAYAVSVAADGKEKECMRIRSVLERRNPDLLNILFEDGYDRFCEELKRDSSIIRMQYELSSLQYKDGAWRRWDGSVLKDSGWEMPDGSIRKDAIYMALSQGNSLCEKIPSRPKQPA